MKILESSVWTLKGQNTQEQLQFFPNGTVTVLPQADAKPNPGGHVSWRIDRIHVTVIFPDREETLYLPIDAKGTKGHDSKGVEFVATGDGAAGSP